MSRTSYLDGLMEAGWLAIVVTLPLFFDKYATNAFESERVLLLRSLALVMLAAWLLKKFLGKGDAARPVFREPALIPVIAYAAINSAAVVWSIDPGASFWGAPGRGMGTYTLLSCLIIFFMTAESLQSFRQVDRIVTLTILVSFPVSLYAIGQRFGIEPILVTRRETETLRVSSHLGHPVFLAAYLAMVVPVISFRVLSAMLELRRVRQFRGQSIFHLLSYSAIGLAATTALWFSGSRGPMLGLVAGAGVLSVMLAQFARRRRLILGLLAGLLVVTAAAMFSPSLRGALSGAGTGPTARRLSSAMDIQSGTALTRSLQWQMAAKAVFSDAPAELGDGQRDRLHPSRVLIGYGPETVKILSRQFISPQLIQAYNGYFVPDRFHNEFWDVLQTTGLLGLIVQVGLAGWIYYFAFQKLGIRYSRKPLFAFWACLLGFAVALACGTAALLGIGFLGLGFCAGIILGMGLYLVLAALSPRSELPPLDHRALLVMTLLSAITAHWVDLAFSFSTGCTEAYFWIWTALVFSVWRIPPPRGSRPDLALTPGSVPVAVDKMSSRRQARFENDGKDDPRQGIRWSSRREALVGGLLLALVLGTLGFELLWRGSGRTPLEIVFGSFVATPNGASHSAWPIAVSVLIVWIFVAAIWSSEIHTKKGEGACRSTLAAILTPSAALGLVYWYATAAQLAGIQSTGPFISDTNPGALSGFDNLVLVYYGFVFLVVCLSALFLAGGGAPHPGRRRPISVWGSLAALSMIVIVLAGVYETNLRWSLADIAAARARQSAENGQLRAASILYGKAADRVPAGVDYVEPLGRALIQEAVRLANPESRDRLFAAAEQELTRGHHALPIDPNVVAALGDLHLNRALVESEGRQRLSLARKAQDCFESALTLEPSSFELWYRRAVVDLIIRGDAVAARKNLQRSLDIMPAYDKAHALKGDAFALEARVKNGKEESDQCLAAAAASYQRAIEIAGPLYSYSSALAEVRTAAGNPRGALDALLKCYDKVPEGERTKVDTRIAQFCVTLRMPQLGLAHAERALKESPADAELLSLHRTLEQLLSEEPQKNGAPARTRPP